MLRIRFSRTGKVGQPSFRIVVAEHRAPVKGRYIEMIGHYRPTAGKTAVFEKERISYWISKGAIPTDAVASLLKKQGLTDMEKYLKPRNKKRSPKGEEAPKEASKTVASAPAPAPVAAPAA